MKRASYQHNELCFDSDLAYLPEVAVMNRCKSQVPIITVSAGV